MARIKVFQGTGPNPNVPFAGDVPRPQFIGQEENAVSRLMGNINKEATEYLELQRKQTDAASVAEADAAKVLFQSELDAQEDIYDSSGNINLELYRDRLDSFYDNMQPNMSSAAYKNWKNTQTVLDARRIGSLMTENMKRTREANKVRFEQSNDLILSNSLTGTFEDMSSSVIMAKQNIDNAVESGIIDMADAIVYEQRSLNKASKTYVDNLVASTEPYGVGIDQTNKMFDNALAFVDADPYGVYSKDEGLRNSVRQDLATKRLQAIKRKNDEYLKNEKAKFTYANQQEDLLFRDLESQGYGIISSGSSDPEELFTYHRTVTDALLRGELSQAKANKLLNMRKDVIDAIDDSNVSIVAGLDDASEALPVASRILNPKKRETAIRISQLPRSTKTGLLNAIKDMPEESSQIMEDYVRYNDVFEDILVEDQSSQFTDEDLFAYVYLKYASPMDSKTIEFRTKYSRKIRDRFGSGVTSQSIQVRLRNILEGKLKRQQQERNERGR